MAWNVSVEPCGGAGDVIGQTSVSEGWGQTDSSRMWSVSAHSQSVPLCGAHCQLSSQTSPVVPDWCDDWKLWLREWCWRSVQSLVQTERLSFILWASPPWFWIFKSKFHLNHLKGFLFLIGLGCSWIIQLISQDYWSRISDIFPFTVFTSEDQGIEAVGLRPAPTSSNRRLISCIFFINQKSYQFHIRSWQPP